MLKPSNFTNFPQNSITQIVRAETIAQRIMQMLARRFGNAWLEWRSDQTETIWHPISWQYFKENTEFKDDKSDKAYFEMVAPYCTSWQQARLFSPSWDQNIISSPSPLNIS